MKHPCKKSVNIKQRNFSNMQLLTVVSKYDRKNRDTLSSKTQLNYCTDLVTTQSQSLYSF